MKKETIIAIFFGILFGTVLAVTLLIKSKEFQFNRTKTIAPTNSANQAVRNVNQSIQSMEITQPADGIIVNENKITLKGKAEKNALVVVETAGSDTVFRNSKGDFITDVPLSFGENNILITVYPTDAQVRPMEKELRIYYLDEQL